jgi:hypothetical protein
LIKAECESTDRRDANSALHLIGRFVGAADWGGGPHEHGPELRPEQHADVEVRHALPHAQQSMDVLGAEPQARQLILRADHLSRFLEAVAAEALQQLLARARNLVDFVDTFRVAHGLTFSPALLLGISLRLWAAPARLVWARQRVGMGCNVRMVIMGRLILFPGS